MNDLVLVPEKMMSVDEYVIINNVFYFYDDHSTRSKKPPNPNVPISIRKQHVREPEYIDIPNSVHTIVFNRNFNQKLDDIRFPNSLHTLIFGNKFNQNIDDVEFPYSLHTIKFGLDFDQDLTCLENTNVHTIDFSNSFVRCFTNVVIPTTIKKVVVKVSDKGLIKLPHGCIEMVID